MWGCKIILKMRIACSYLVQSIRVLEATTRALFRLVELLSVVFPSFYDFVIVWRTHDQFKPRWIPTKMSVSIEKLICASFQKTEFPLNPSQEKSIKWAILIPLKTTNVKPTNKNKSIMYFTLVLLGTEPIIDWVVDFIQIQFINWCKIKNTQIKSPAHSCK